MTDTINGRAVVSTHDESCQKWSIRYRNGDVFLDDRDEWSSLRELARIGGDDGKAE